MNIVLSDLVLKGKTGMGLWGGGEERKEGYRDGNRSLLSWGKRLLCQKRKDRKRVISWGKVNRR